MTKSKLYLKSLVKAGLLLNLLIISSLIYGCSSSTKPTVKIENIKEEIQNIAKEEYNLKIKARLVGSTLWVYLPLEDMLAVSDKPQKYTERFMVEENKNQFQQDILKFEYLIKPVPEAEKYQQYTYSKQAAKKINDVWMIIRRVLFSMDKSKESQLKFLCLVAADIRNGFEIKQLAYYMDLKKVSYQYISWSEYQHRFIDETNIDEKIIQDAEGLHLEYKDISLEEFIAEQIKQRIRFKFQKPEAERNADIDKEILEAVILTIKIYGFKNFDYVELNNLLTNNKIILNRAAVWEKAIQAK